MPPPGVLIAAPNASSRFGGEAFLPLKYYQILRRRGHPVRLVAHARNRDDLADFLGPADLAGVAFVPDTAWHRAVWRFGQVLPGPLRGALAGTLLDRVNAHFQARIIRRLVAGGAAGVIHQPIPVSPLAPSSLHRFGLPLVIGPMNGGMDYPPGYDDLEGPAARLFTRFARRLARGLNRLVPGKRRAAVLLVANERTRRALPFPGHPRVVLLPENGVDLAAWTPPPRTPRPAGAPFRLAFMGRLVDWKAVDITLEALALARARGVAAEIEIIGDGPGRARLEARAAQADLAGAVRFPGFLPQALCAPRLAAADALILNSVRECGGAVVLEAMAMGLPVIGPDWGGPADYLDESCGILVAPVPRGSFAARLADAIARLAADPGLCARMGAAGAAKVRAEYDWERKVDRMLEIYAEAAAATPADRRAG